VGAVGFFAQVGEDEFALLLQGHTPRSLSHILKGEWLCAEKLGNCACAAEALGQSAALILLEQNPGCSLEHSADTGDRAITVRGRAAYF
jgi:hypothetical protein